MVHIGRRLQTIAQFIPKGSIVADIGSDHGLLLEYCLAQGIIEKGYASDNKLGPYQRLLKRFGHHSHVGVYLADGLAKLPPDVDTIVIAGMGGNLISRIIYVKSDRLAQIRHIIVSPHQQVEELRLTMMNLGYGINDETIVSEDHKYYDVISFSPSSAQYSHEQLKYGPLNLLRRPQALLDKMADRIDEIHRILAHDLPMSKRDELTKELEWLTHYDQNK
jgi:tRNA (adenine22-N1)-methyltransferase